MSRILRRPMFRGGPVDSRGTGITSGLMDGGRVGYNRGMLVQPPGASRLFSIQDVLKQTGAPMTGKQIFDYAAEKGMISCTDYGRPERKKALLHGRKFNPTPKFLDLADAYFVCHIGPIFPISLIYAFIGCPLGVRSP